MKAGLVKGAANHGIAVGFHLLRELELENSYAAMHGLAQSVNTSDERTEFLELHRKYAKTSSNPEGIDFSRFLDGLSGGLVRGGFEAASEWIAENELSPEELESFSSSISNSSKSEEKGQWIAWMGENLSGRERQNKISNTMRSWTRSDYRAAGEWLAAAPQGATKNTAVEAYAETVGKYDPATAAQWAMTLPQGPERTRTLEKIHSNLPENTPTEKAAREGFAKQYGISE